MNWPPRDADEMTKWLDKYGNDMGIAEFIGITRSKVRKPPRRPTPRTKSHRVHPRLTDAYLDDRKGRD